MSKFDWPKRLYMLDISRGFAAMAVVLSHWVHFFYKNHSLPNDFENSSLPLYSVFKIFYEKGSYGVEFFFLLSGFVFFWLYKDLIYLKKITFKMFWVQRFSRLYPLHLFTLLLVAFLQYTYFLIEDKSFTYTNNDIYHFLLNLFFASNWGFEMGWSFNGPIWSVSIEILLYMFFFIVIINRIGGIIFCLIVSIISPLLLFYLGHVFFKGLAMFFLGGLVYQVTKIIYKKFNKSSQFIYFLTILFWSMTIVDFYIFNFSKLIATHIIFGEILLLGFPFYILFPLTVSSLALIELNNGNKFQSISWVGNITYSSYLLHFPLQICFSIVLSHILSIKDFYMHYYYLLAFFAILIPLSLFVFIYLERPLQKVIRKNFYEDTNLS